jgi:PAS domain S-box-containing protein
LLTDIDERKRAEELLRASEGNLKLIIDTIPALAWSARPDGSAEFLNQHYLDFIGLAAEQASGWDWTAAVHPDDLSGLTSTWQRVMASEARGEAEARLRRYDGVYRWFLFRANPLRDETGTIVKWYGVNTDIEDRKRAEEALRKSEHHFRLLVETIPALVWRGTPEGELDYLNQRAIEYLGRSAQSLSGGGWLELVHPDHRDTTIQRWLHSVATGSSYEDVYRLRRANGEYRWIQSVGQPFHDTEGRIAHWYGLVLDIEDRKESEEALNKARSELARVARITTMGTLTASIAHEVNQPLSGIITNAGTCLRMLDTAPPDIEGARQTARRTIRDGNRASDVITRLRALFSHKEFTLEPLDLNEATREVVALSLSDLQRNGVALQLELADDLPTITGDRIQLQQVILNLLRNASDAMVDVHDRTRHLLIKSEREDTARVRMTVRDVGVGVAPDSIDRLFDPFYTTKSDGMGIGLSVSRSIIERHQGRLWAQANDGSPGATFSFSIPREDGGRGAHPAPTTS